MEEKRISQEESLQIIHSMIDMAKNKFNESGFHFLLWGALVVAASLAQYFMMQNGLGKESNFVWLVITVVGIVVAFIYEYKKSKSERTKSKFDKMYGYLWLGFGITLFITIFISLSHQVMPIAFILVLVGLATFVSGAIYKFTPLIIGAIIFWLAGALCAVLPATEQLLVNAIATVLGYLVPGILLWKKSKSVSHV